MLANRSTATATSGRRRANPRTYCSTSQASLAKPPRGSDFGSMVSVKTAGSRGAEPYTVVVDFTTSRRTEGAFWQAPSSCMVPMTLVSLTAERLPRDRPSGVPLMSMWTTVSTEYSASTLAIIGCRMSARTNSASPRPSWGGTASTPTTFSTPGSPWMRRTKRPASRRATPVTSTTLPTIEALLPRLTGYPVIGTSPEPYPVSAALRRPRDAGHDRRHTFGRRSSATAPRLPGAEPRRICRCPPATAPCGTRGAAKRTRRGAYLLRLLLVAALHTRALEQLAVLLLGHALTALLDD